MLPAHAPAIFQVLPYTSFPPRTLTLKYSNIRGFDLSVSATLFPLLSTFSMEFSFKTCIATYSLPVKHSRRLFLSTCSLVFADITVSWNESGSRFNLHATLFLSNIQGPCTSSSTCWSLLLSGPFQDVYCKQH
jgi:hypothetical protein